MRKKLFWGILIILISVPFLMWLGWLLTPNTKLVMAIVDKTVLNKKGQEHISLNWVLNHEKYTKTSSKAYEVSRDYFGFFPEENENFQLKGLERFSYSKLDQLSNDADIVYFTDTYGIYNNEWFKNGDTNERSGILYGGLSDKDIYLLKQMKEKNKLIIAEFNTIGSPTAYQNRREFEEMFKMKWTGWTARYFDNLNIRENQEIPAWLIRNYKKTHGGGWPFKKSGIAFVNNKDEVVILEQDTHLTESMPHIITDENYTKEFSIPESIKYPFWFDVIIPDEKINDAVSIFQINTNENGLSLLKDFGIPASFPAVIKHSGNDYDFFYFSGDFADNPVSLESSYFKGIGFFKGLFYDERNIMERGSFFWKYYKPLLTNILDEHSSTK
ncbi:hypothetical protein NE848_03255 [Gramella jeungdoensis]|uniref:Uncharacterized protein n=1 Tax=Gramella jeungdoensis TaxID=708091 RepID=A0ABT0YZ14_9FLAO|nr:hypothetical protein [Gramella jeungdoensis]MCM8568378.1 hypothetical protein [Gramella jeungdoensis]